MNAHARKWIGGIALTAVMFTLPQLAFAQKKVVRFMFDGPVSESPNPDNALAALFGGEQARSLYDWTKMIRKGAKDDSVAGAIMIVQSPAMSLAQLEEIGRALNEFRAAGKKIHCFMDSGTNLSYALASHADHVTVAEIGDLWIVGLSAAPMFYKGLFDKIGVQADMLHCGAYKSALEPYTRTEPSKEAAENINWLLDGIYARWTEMIAKNRKLKVEEVKAAVDSAPVSGKKAVELKLIDAVSSFGDFGALVEKEYGKDVVVLTQYGKKKGLEIEPGDLMGMMEAFKELFGGGEEKKSGKSAIALIYVDGMIIDGKSQQDPFSGGAAGSTTIRAALEKAREDDTVKAVVLRVDSPGGSALASDIMWDAATKLGKAKPLIVSMGSVAGSGGYYVSLPGDTIFAEDSTITGSIGVVGGKLVWNTLMTEHLGLTTTEFSRGKNSLLFSPNRAWTPDEKAKMTQYMTDIYDQFKARVTASRGSKIKGDLESLAGGRVYTGKQALERGLIDKIGGLNDALALAAEKADLKDYDVKVLPKPMEFADMLKKMFGEETDDDWKISMAPAASISSDPLISAALPAMRALSPEAFRRVVQDLRNVLIMNRERVTCFMPFAISPN